MAEGRLTQGPIRSLRKTSKVITRLLVSHRMCFALALLLPAL